MGLGDVEETCRVRGLVIPDEKRGAGRIKSLVAGPARGTLSKQL